MCFCYDWKTIFLLRSRWMNYSVAKKAVYFCGGRVCTLQQTVSRRGLGWMDRKEGNRVRLCCELIPALRWRVGVSAGDKWLNVMRSRGEAFHALQNFRHYCTSGCLFQTSDITGKGFFVLKIKVFCKRRQTVLGPFGHDPWRRKVLMHLQCLCCIIFRWYDVILETRVCVTPDTKHGETAL